uniref:Uncharacterized protein n=1 Tax=Thermogemmatispora argillosa TaxID=2045280 RepID=A0A455T2E0_9CHLR|nr:hypothetical protein KTA_15910 [Thermogemmatispora argillosa]
MRGVKGQEQVGAEEGEPVEAGAVLQEGVEGGRRGLAQEGDLLEGEAEPGAGVLVEAEADEEGVGGLVLVPEGGPGQGEGGFLLRGEAGEGLGVPELFEGEVVPDGGPLGEDGGDVSEAQLPGPGKAGLGEQVLGGEGLQVLWAEEGAGGLDMAVAELGEAPGSEEEALVMMEGEQEVAQGRMKGGVGAPEKVVLKERGSGWRESKA